MKHRSLLVLCVLFLLTAFAVRSNPPAQPGMMSYTPTRLEWLALELEASYREDFSRDSDYDIHYLAKPPNTILIFLHYRTQASAPILDHAIDTAKQLVNQTAGTHGWSSWVKIEVQRKAVPK